ncbi:MAG: SMC-Scp complex subunit ScpB [Candidatus Krumholzibacteriota bacterium]|nr:SMC-Scp complex subunit ScpB [Candidatus Krumholzibacteriota bacterium]
MTADLKRTVEALLFAAPEPLSLGSLQNIIPRCDRRGLRAAIDELRRDYDEAGHAFELTELAGGWRIMTRPEHTRRIEEMLKGERRVRLSRAALEVLAVVAYRQPCTRVDVDDVRGVNSGGALATLLERGLLRIAGRAETLGRPLLYATTDEFLGHLGLNSLDDLPNLAEIEALLVSAQRPDESPLAPEERRLRLVENMDQIAEVMGDLEAPGGNGGNGKGDGDHLDEVPAGALVAAAPATDTSEPDEPALAAALREGYAEERAGLEAAPAPAGGDLLPDDGVPLVEETDADLAADAVPVAVALARADVDGDDDTEP